MPLDRDIRLGLTFDDVLLVPRHSSIRSRQDVSLKTRLTRTIGLDIPVIAANMDTVCESEMAIALGHEGGAGMIHRFLPVEDQAEMVREVKKHDLPVGAAIGTDFDALDRSVALLEAGVDVLVLDIAHGHSSHALDMLQKIKSELGESAQVIAGNVATRDGARDLVAAGADAIKVGVGPGGVCTTRLVAGVGVPQLSAIADCAGFQVPVIADGGIRTSGDIAKALAAGADSVMIGSMLAGTKESPGEFKQTSNGLVKQLRGMASFEAVTARAARSGEQVDEEYFEQRAPEGVTAQVVYKGEAVQIIRTLMAGVKSSMSYSDARTIPEFWEKSEFIQVTSAGVRENHPHAVSG